MQLTPITIRYPLRPASRSLATGEVGDLFGLEDAPAERVVADGVTLELPDTGGVVLFTGPSGSGKSSLLRAVADRVKALDVMGLELPGVPVIDALEGPVPERLALLGSCGLGEAALMLRTPAELSEGQRYRFRLALALEAARKCGVRWVRADEFAAYLDRTLAKIVAFNLARRLRQTGIGALLATTHDDLTDELDPDLWVRCHGDGEVETRVRAKGAVKKKSCRGSMSSGSARGPSPTGRTSLGGITAATGSASPAASSCSGTATGRRASSSSPAHRQA